MLVPTTGVVFVFMSLLLMWHLPMLTGYQKMNSTHGFAFVWLLGRTLSGLFSHYSYWLFSRFNHDLALFHIFLQTDEFGGKASRHATMVLGWNSLRDAAFMVTRFSELSHWDPHSNLFLLMIKR